MWPFKKQPIVDRVEKIIEKKEYGDVVVTLINEETLEFKSWQIVTTDHFINFQTSDGWIEVKIDYIKSIHYKEISGSNIVSLHKESQNA